MHEVNEAYFAFGGRLNEHCAASITEQNARGAIGVVGHAGVGVGAVALWRGRSLLVVFVVAIATDALLRLII